MHVRVYSLILDWNQNVLFDKLVLNFWLCDYLYVFLAHIHFKALVDHSVTCWLSILKGRFNFNFTAAWLDVCTLCEI